ncbi:MAG: hypothetical protein JRG71_14215, partial [Deltaproteobacteria bacterium]|nr:hypothetical protein [Deltaproteobacteria bacterium]
RMIYGGSDACSDEPITAVDHPYMGQGASALITLPPLGMLVLQWEY